jgi:alpha-tubulin suppressor-like RCC1 family protein
VLIPPFANERVLMVACGEYHTLSLTATGRVWSTGLNLCGQLGLGDLETRYLFTEVDKINFVAGRKEGCNVISVVAGETHSMMLCQNGLLFSCGKNDDGVLGVGDTVDRSTPNLIMGLSDKNVYSIAAGVYHNLAITDEGRLFSWGKGWYGQLGHGHSRDTRLPKEVWLSETADDFVIMASGGMHHTMILTRDKTVWSCGRGCHGVLATGDLECHLVPVRTDMGVFKEINRDNQVMMVVAGHHHTGFVASDGTMYMCGRGDGGNIWFKSEDGPGGLSLPRQMWPRLKPVIVRTTRGLELMDPILVGPGIAWNKNLFELVRAFWMNKKDKSSLSSPWMSEVEPDVMEMIARLVLSSPMPEHAQYHKSVRMLMGSVN